MIICKQTKAWAMQIRVWPRIDTKILKLPKFPLAKISTLSYFLSAKDSLSNKMIGLWAH